MVDGGDAGGAVVAGGINDVFRRPAYRFTCGLDKPNDTSGITPVSLPISQAEDW
jgi:hypothetical protein